MNEPIAAHTPGARWSRGLPGTERSLVRSAADGDPRAFETIFKRHAQELYRYCLAIVRRLVEREAALQEAQFADEGGAVRLYWMEDDTLRFWATRNFR